MSKTFEATFGAPSSAKQFVPGRVNLIGEHTDYNGGFVLPTVIEPGISIEAAFNSGKHDRYFSALDDSLIERAPNSARAHDWADYVGGMLDLMREAAGSKACFDLAIKSSLPAGAGVSSSAALTVAVGKVVRDLLKTDLTDIDIAKTAQRVENDYIGVPCGIMDQMAVSLGRSGCAIKLDTKTLEIENVPLLADHDFVVVHSGIHRKLEDGRYGERRRECELAAKHLGVDYLCDIDIAALNSSGNSQDDAHKRARHVISDHHRVFDMVHALKVQDALACGAILRDGHRSLSQDFNVSTPQIDALVERAQHHGALGARLTGGGFGGCIVALVPTESLASWFHALKSDHPQIWLVSPKA